MPSPWADRIWGRLTGHAPCRLFFDFDGPAALGFVEGSGQFHGMIGWMASWMWMRMARRTSHALLSFETCWGTSFECEETKPWIEYYLGLVLNRLICRDVNFLVHVREREAGDLVDQNGLDLVDLVAVNGVRTLRTWGQHIPWAEAGREDDGT